MISERPFLVRYGLAVASVAFATSMRLLLNPLLGVHTRYATFLVAILITAWYGGGGPAFSALILAIISTDFFLIPPAGNFMHKGTAGVLELALYSSVGFCIALIGGLMHSVPQTTIRKLREARETLCKTEERLRLTVHSAGIGVWNRDLGTNLIEADANCAILFGFQPGEFPKTFRGACRQVSCGGP